MSTVPCKFQAARVQPPTAHFFLSIYKIIRLAFVCAFILLVVLVVMIYSFNHHLLTKTGCAAGNATVQSPLQNLIMKEQAALQEELRESDCEMLKKINDKSTLEVKSLIIAETIVPYEDRDKLVEYISRQLESSDVVSKVQTVAIMTMVNLAPIEGSVTKEDTGQRGSLRNCAVLALIRRHHNNVHFMMIGVRAEPRLGWRWISPAERNTWNNVLSRVLTNKVRVEAQNYLWQRTVDEMPEVIQEHARENLALQSLLRENINVQ